MHVARWLLVLLGVGFLYAALFLREDEEGHIQSIIDHLWMRIDDQHLRSKGTALMQTSANLVSDALDFTFGPRLLSLEALIVATSLSIISFNLTAALLYERLIAPRHPDSPGDFMAQTALLAVVVVGLGWAVFGCRTLRQRRKALWLSLHAAIWVAITVLPIVFSADMRDVFLDARVVSLTALSIVIGIAADFLFLALTRRIVRAMRTGTLGRILALIVVNGVLALPLAYLPIRVFLPGAADVFLRRIVRDLSMATLSDWYPAAWIVVSAPNLFDLLAAFATVIVGAFLMLDRLLWPLINRLMYPLARYGVLKQKRLLGWTGGLFITLAFAKTEALAKSILEAFK